MSADQPAAPRESDPKAQVRDHRPRPTGVMPASLQTWAMVGIAGVIVVIVLATQNAPHSPAPPRDPSANTPRPPSQDIVGDFRTRLDAQERQRAEARRQLAEQERASTTPSQEAAQTTTSHADGADPLSAVRQDKARRDYESLFADPVAYTTNRRSAPPTITDLAASTTFDPALAAALNLAARNVATPTAATTDTKAASPASNVDIEEQHSEGNLAELTPPLSSGGPWYRVLEGTILEAVLTTRLDGDFSGPAQALVTTPVYSHDTRALLIPAGSRLLGEARAVTAAEQRRLAVAFHRLVWPDGRTLSLDQSPALNQIGETGLRDRVHRHYASVFGSAIAIAAIAGLANAGFGIGGGSSVIVRGGTGIEQAANQIFQQYLNRRPEITIREGHRLRVLLTADLDLPTYTPGELLPARPPRDNAGISPRTSGDHP